MFYLYIFLPNHSHKILYGLYIQYLDKLYYLQTMNIQNIKYLSIGLKAKQKKTKRVHILCFGCLKYEHHVQVLNNYFLTRLK